MASPETLVRQASITAEQYLIAAVESIDDTFGEGYAARHPELVAAFMRTAAVDFNTAIFAQEADNIAEILRELISNIRRK